jgi:putative peptidoglycan lipid II flippase
LSSPGSASASRPGVEPPGNAAGLVADVPAGGPIATTGAGGRIASAALILMLGTVLSRLLGLVREQLAADRFGTGDEIAAFTVADNVATLIYDLMVSGALQAALIPVLAGLVVVGAADRATLRRVSGTLLVLALAGVGGLAVLGFVFAPAVVRGMTALAGEGNARGKETTELAVELVRWMLPGVVLLGAGTVMMAVLHAVGRVAAPALALAARNAAIVIALLLVGGPLGVRSLALGTVLGAAAIFVLQVPPLVRAGALPRLCLDLQHPAVREVFRLYLPILLGLLVSTAGVVIDRNLAWGAGEDALGAMRYATTLVQMVLGIVAAAISLAALPALSRHHSGGDEVAFRGTLGRALAMTTVLIVPATLGLAAIGRPTVDLLFGHGATGEADAHQIAIALVGYLPGTLAAAYDQVLIFAFYARRDTRTPVLVGVMAIGVYLVVALALVEPLGMLGLVLANSAQWVSHALVMWWLARRRWGALGSASLRRTFLVAGTAAGATAFVALTLSVAIDSQLPNTLASQFAAVAVPAVTALMFYAAVLQRFGVPEVELLRRALVSRLSPRFFGRAS